MSDQGGEVTLEFLGRILREVQVEQREQRTELRDMRSELRDVHSEQRDIRSLLLAQVEHSRRAEQRIAELRDDLELMLKSELMGRLGHFETQIKRRLDELTERMGALETGRPD